MNLLPLEILPLWATSLLALSLLGGGSYLLLWLLGIPLPILAIVFLIRGCH